MAMKSLISIALAVLVVVAAQLGAPEATRAQTSGDGQAGTPTPTPAPSAPVSPPAGPSTAAEPTPAAAEDAVPQEPTADEAVVREAWADGGEPGFGPGAGRNIVFVLNRADGSRRMRGRIRLVHVTGDRAEPVNAAFANASCTDCQSFAVALEIALISPHAAVIVPQNRARAINHECTRCITVARALQYVYAVEDPDRVPDNVGHLLHVMEEELRAIGRDPTVTPAQANARVSAVIAQFQELNTALQDELVETEEVTSPGATPADVAPSGPAPMPSPSPSAP